MIVQEKSDEQLNLASSCIIDSLEEFNIAEKYKIISSLYHSLTETIKVDGIIIEKEIADKTESEVVTRKSGGKPVGLGLKPSHKTENIKEKKHGNE